MTTSTVTTTTKYLTTNDDEGRKKKLWACGELQIHTDIYHFICFTLTQCVNDYCQIFPISHIKLRTRYIRQMMNFTFSWVMIQIEIVSMITSLVNVMTRLQFCRFIIHLMLNAFMSFFFWIWLRNCENSNLLAQSEGTQQSQGQKNNNAWRAQSFELNALWYSRNLMHCSTLKHLQALHCSLQ